MIKAVIFDIYGTLLKLKAGDLDDSIHNHKKQIKALRKIEKKYKLNLNEEEVLAAFVDEVRKEHHRKEKNGVKYPEVVIEKVWKRVFKRLKIKKVNFYDFAYDYYDFCDPRHLYAGTKKMLLIYSRMLY